MTDTPIKCYRCPAEAAPGRERCRHCLASNNAIQKARYRTRVAALGRPLRVVRCPRCDEQGHFAKMCTAERPMRGVA